MNVHSDRRRKARLAAAAAAGLGGLAVIRSVLPAGTPPIRVKDKESAERARPIATLEKVRLGGSDQWILEAGRHVPAMPTRRLVLPAGVLRRGSRTLDWLGVLS